MMMGVAGLVKGGDGTIYEREEWVEGGDGSWWCQWEVAVLGGDSDGDGDMRWQCTG